MREMCVWKLILSGKGRLDKLGQLMNMNSIVNMPDGRRSWRCRVGGCEAHGKIAPSGDVGDGNGAPEHVCEEWK